MRSFQHSLLLPLFAVASLSASAFAAPSEALAVNSTAQSNVNPNAAVQNALPMTPVGASITTQELVAQPVFAISAQNLYEVDLPSGSEQSNAVLNESQLSAFAEQGMRLLLVRLTGKSVLLQSPRVEPVLQKSRVWLKTYSYVPLIQEGVKVGQTLRLKFDEQAVKQALAENQIKIWPLNLRPKMLLMGTLVENNTISKLDQSGLQYRVDINVRRKFAEMGLNVGLPTATTPWIYPMDPANNIGPLQDVLTQADQDKLLSYKLVNRAQGYELSWYLFDQNGTVLAKGKAEAAERDILFDDMVNLVLSRLVELNRQVLEINDQVVINLVNIADLQSLQQAREQLQQALPTLTDMRLVEVKSQLAQLEIAYRGDYASLIKWIAGLPQFSVIRSSEMLRQLDVSFTYIEPVAPNLPAANDAGLSTDR